MKKIVLSVLLFVSVLFGDSYGVIESVNYDTKTIRVNGMDIKVMPYTEIEEDTCFGFDTNKTFSALKAGQVVEIDFNGYTNNTPIAKDIDIKCSRNSAY